MINISSKLTENLVNKDIMKISKLKNSFWHYGIKSNYNWFKKNMKKNDFHILLYLKEELIGYLCLRKRTATMNKQKIKYFYFDTLVVNSKYKGKSFGHLIMMSANNIIQKNNLHSFLLCTDKHVNYYKKFNWVKLKKNYFKTLDHKSNLNGMVFNFEKVKFKTRMSYKINT